jgi:hypothetical protein
VPAELPVRKAALRGNPATEILLIEEQVFLLLIGGVGRTGQDNKFGRSSPDSIPKGIWNSRIPYTQQV